MLLTYSHKQFPALIMAGIKIHTIREDKNDRWRVGMSIQHWMYNPRHVKKNPYRFAQEMENINKCLGIQRISVIITSKETIITIDGRELPKNQFEQFAINDGFTSWRQMAAYFKNIVSNWKIIHFTDFKY